MLVILALEIESITLVPAIINVVHGIDEFSHLPGCPVPGHSKPAGNMRFNLRAQAQDKPILAKCIQVVAKMRHAHGIAGKSNRH